MRSGYGFEMMQLVSKHMQSTFSYVGYDKTPDECIEMLRDGQLDLYTAAKRTPEREAEFAISKHPSITAVTSMNVKIDNTKVVAGDYSTYNGLRIGLLARHTYNEAFLSFVKEKGFTCDIVYYDTPAELSNALVNGEVDALVNSYIRTPEDEREVEDFGETPYYFMARKLDQALVDQIDAAIDAMNIETPNWRTDLYNKYYGAVDKNVELTDSEQELLDEMQANGVVVRGIMNPGEAPFSWYENGEAKGIAADIFRACARTLGLECEIVPASSREEYLDALESGNVDAWMDFACNYEDERSTSYRATDPYLTTTVSLLRARDASGPVETLAVIDYSAKLEQGECAECASGRRRSRIYSQITHGGERQRRARLLRLVGEGALPGCPSAKREDDSVAPRGSGDAIFPGVSFRASPLPCHKRCVDSFGSVPQHPLRAFHACEAPPASRLRSLGRGS